MLHYPYQMIICCKQMCNIFMIFCLLFSCASSCRLFCWASFFVVEQFVFVSCHLLFVFYWLEKVQLFSFLDTSATTKYQMSMAKHLIFVMHYDCAMYMYKVLYNTCLFCLSFLKLIARAFSMANSTIGIYTKVYT